jgi:undecaprenyl-diphosphatase
MHDMWRAVILGVVEGITEFLPVSSTGHLILVDTMLGLRDDDPFWSGTFDIFIQIGAILAVMIYFWRRLWRLIFHYHKPPAENPAPGSTAGHLFPHKAPSGAAVLEYAPASPAVARAWWDHILVKLFVAFIPAAVVGLLASDFIEARLKNAAVVATALVLGGIGILVIEKVVRHPRWHDAGTIPLRIALFIGIAQCAALIPGTSRSAATIMGALLVGLSPVAAAEFSFFLAIPTMIAAGIYSLLKHLDQIEPHQFGVLAVGFVVSFIVALAVVAAFMRFIQTHRFTVFAVYRILVGIIVLGIIAWA